MKNLPKNKIQHLAPEEILVIHSRVIEETTGLHGVRDIGGLIAACERPKAVFNGKDLYPGIFEKAGAIFESLILNHPFLDGNKRTAITAAARFLFQNGYELVASSEEIVLFALKTVVEKPTIKEIALWFEKNFRKII